MEQCLLCLNCPARISAAGVNEVLALGTGEGHRMACFNCKSSQLRYFQVHNSRRSMTAIS